MVENVTNLQEVKILFVKGLALSKFMYSVELILWYPQEIKN